MDFLELNQRVMKLLTAGQFDSAEAELHQARLQASKQTDRYALEQVLSSLVELYCIMQPPDLTKAESYSLERERISGTGKPR
jgi:predicted ATPase